MEQISMFDDVISYPETYADIDALYQKYIYEGETDDDVFEGKQSETDEKRSYYFYGQKAFEFTPKGTKTATLKFTGAILKKAGVGVDTMQDENYYVFRSNSSEDLRRILDCLKQFKAECFDNLNCESFLCCNDFIRCSDAKECLHKDKREYNNCSYRRNLEAGRIFYGKNKNV